MLQKLDADVIKVMMVGVNSNKLTKMQGRHKLHIKGGMLERLFPDTPVPQDVEGLLGCAV